MPRRADGGGPIHVRPSGTITFLFTDIEGSTLLWEAHRNAMRDALALHDQVLRDSIDVAGGYVFATGGDAFSAAFASAEGAIDATPDGGRIVTSSIDGVAVVWEASTLDVVATLEHGVRAAGDVAISPDGLTVAVASTTGVVQIWDVGAAVQERTLEGHIGRVNTVRFRPDGSLLATGGGDGTARVWDTTSWEQTRVFSGHDGEVLDVAFSPDGNTLVTTGRDGTIRLRMLDADTLIATARAGVTRSLTDAECAAYVPSGTCD